MRCEIRRLQSLHAALQYCLNWNQRITSGCITVIATGHEQTPLRMKNQARDCILNFTLWLRSTEAPGMQTLQRSNSVTRDNNNGDNPSLMKDSWFDSDSAFFLQTVDWYNLIYCNTFSVESAWEAFPATLLTAIDQHVVRIVKVNNRGKKYYPPGVCKCVIKKGMLGNHSNPTVIVVYRQQYYGCIGRLSTGCRDYISKLTAKRQVVQLSGVARGGQNGRSPPPQKKKLIPEHLFISIFDAIFNSRPRSPVTVNIYRASYTCNTCTCGLGLKAVRNRPSKQKSRLRYFRKLGCLIQCAQLLLNGLVPVVCNYKRQAVLCLVVQLIPISTWLYFNV